MSPQGRLRPLAFGATDGLVALLQGSPLAVWEFWMKRPSAPAGGLVSRLNRANPKVGTPSDIVGVAPDGAAWLLDSRTGRVMSLDISGRRAVIAGLGGGGTVRTACALGERAIAFLDDSTSGQVYFRTLTQPSTVYALPFPAGLVNDDQVPWTALRFGGSPNGPCVLWAPLMPTVVVVSDTAVHALGPFVEASVPDTWPSRLARWISGSSRTAGALDATSFRGGVAILFGGRTPQAGRLVDLYSETGKFLETMLLPHRALRVAAARDHLFVLSQQGDHIMLASYKLPRAAGVEHLPDELNSVVPADPRHFDDQVSNSEALEAIR